MISRQQIIKALNKSANKHQAAEDLGVSRQWLDKLIKRHNIKVTRGIKVNENID